MNNNQSRKTIIIGIIISLILITWSIFSWPIDLYSIKFWIFVFVALFESIVGIVINELLQKRKKKKKRKDNKKLLKQYNVAVLVACIVSVLLIVSIIAIIWIFSVFGRVSNIYPEGTITYEMSGYEKSLIVPSYSLIDGEYWGEVVVFRSPKSYNQLKAELADILNSAPFEVYETEDGDVYYNTEEDYTIIEYNVNRNLFINSFNLVYCDGLCD